ncbi:MAG: DUF3137 domain-containing protein [Alphaproteobacteria bacterium]|nr:DUF3137 domain-containing protein [Alphaproteobacteria bacterium]
MKEKQTIFDPVERMNDARFDAEIDKLIAFAEELRMSLMRQHRARSGVATASFIFFVLIGSIGFGYFLLFEGRADIGMMCVMLAIVFSYMVHMWSEKPLTAYKMQYKLQFMPKLARLLGGLRFFPSRGIGRGILEKTGVLPKFETYRAEDCFMGKYKGVKVIFSEARLYQSKKEVAPLFDGIFVLLEASSDLFDSHTIISSDHHMTQAYASKRWKNLSPVQFEKLPDDCAAFKAYSSAPESAASILGETFLKELSEASVVFKNAPITAVLFRKKYVFMMIPYAHDMFEASDIHIPVKTRQHAQQCRKEIDQILEIIDVFDIFKEKAIAENSPEQDASDSPDTSNDE